MSMFQSDIILNPVEDQDIIVPLFTGTLVTSAISNSYNPTYGFSSSDSLVGSPGEQNYSEWTIPPTGSGGAPSSLGSVMDDKTPILGTSDDDHILGTPDDDEIHGGEGDDELNGSGGNDTIFGGAGGDVLRGNSGNDYLEGGQGDDELRGSAGDDDLFGGQGNDELFDGTGDDDLFGGEGDDTLRGDEGDDNLYGGEGDDTLRDYQGNNRLYGGAGDDYLMAKGWGNSSLYGGDGDDTLLGNSAANLLVGGSGADIYSGGGGDDIYLSTADGAQDTFTVRSRLSRYGSHVEIHGFELMSDPADTTHDIIELELWFPPNVETYYFIEHANTTGVADEVDTLIKDTTFGNLMAVVVDVAIPIVLDNPHFSILPS